MRKSNVFAHVHFVWNIHPETPPLSPGDFAWLKEAFRIISDEKGFEIEVVGGCESQVHVIITMKSTQSIAWAANQLKGVSSRWYSREWGPGKDFYWEERYHAVTILPKDLPAAKSYVLAQRPEGTTEDHGLKGWKALFQLWSSNRAA